MASPTINTTAILIKNFDMVMIDKLFGSIAQAVDTGHPFWLALVGVIACFLFISVVVICIGIATARPLEPDEY